MTAAPLDRETAAVMYELLSAGAFGNRSETKCPGCQRIIENTYTAKRAHVASCAELRGIAEDEEDGDDPAWADMTLAQKREEMGGPNGGDGADD